MHGLTTLRLGINTFIFATKVTVFDVCQLDHCSNHIVILRWSQVSIVCVIYF